MKADYNSGQFLQDLGKLVEEPPQSKTWFLVLEITKVYHWKELYKTKG
jgi:hypothetical protein